MNKDMFDLSLWTGMFLFIYTALGILYRFFGKSGLFVSMQLFQQCQTL